MKGSNQTSKAGILVVCMLLFVMAASGCASFPATKTDYSAGTVLILPPRDVVQNGEAHERGAGSGRILAEYLEKAFSRTSFETIRTDSRHFTNARKATKDEALDEAAIMKADYVLQLVLGEFQDAAPMTFRPDFVWLEEGSLFETKTGKEVWRLTKPVYLQKGNPGSYTPLLKELAKQLAKSIASGK